MKKTVTMALLPAALLGIALSLNAYADDSQVVSLWYPKVAPILNNSCSQCHVAKENGKKGMAARKFDLTNFLSTKQLKLSGPELSMLENVIQKQSMPPKPYTWLHPDSKVSPSNKAILLDWIHAEQAN